MSPVVAGACRGWLPTWLPVKLLAVLTFGRSDGRVSGAAVSGTGRSALGGRCWKLCGGVRGGIADRQPHGPVPVGYQVKPPAQRLHVARDDLERGHLTVLDLGYPGHAQPHGSGDVLLRQVVTAGPGEQLACAVLNLRGRRQMPNPMACTANNVPTAARRAVGFPSPLDRPQIV